MKRIQADERNVSRRQAMRLAALGAAMATVPNVLAADVAPATASAELDADLALALKACKAHPVITPAKGFGDVSRGTPKPHSLKGQAAIDARLTPESWRLEITADPFMEAPHTKTPASLTKQFTLADNTAIDLPALMELGKKHEVHFLKAIQCLNIETPLGQGMWTGVPLREVLRLCGKMNNVRRVYYWGFHNNDEKQIFKSSLSYTQGMETAPGELPAFLAYRLNGEPIPPERGGPVRMIIPWSHGYKSIKWLQHIFVTNDARNQDSYANNNNDPDSYLKTAAYVHEGPPKLKAGDAVTLTGTVICGLSGLKRVEYWVRKVQGNPPRMEYDDPELLNAPWKPCVLAPQPDWNTALPRGVKPTELLGFDAATGQPHSWPTRYGMCAFAAVIRGLEKGKYEIRARTVDMNDFAQPEPRPLQKSGRNAIQVWTVELV